MCLLPFKPKADIGKTNNVKTRTRYINLVNFKHFVNPLTAETDFVKPVPTVQSRTSRLTILSIVGSTVGSTQKCHLDISRASNGLFQTQRWIIQVKEFSIERVKICFTCRSVRFPLHLFQLLYKQTRQNNRQSPRITDNGCISSSLIRI